MAPRAQETLAGDVLFVDDERIIAETVATILKQYGVPARAAFDGDQAVRAVREKAPALILMNIVMPHSGVEAALEIRASFPHIPIVMHTGGEGNAEYARNSGFQEVLWKPIHPTDLLRVVQRYGFKPKAPPDALFPVPPCSVDSA